MTDITTLAIPFYFLAMALEGWVGRHRGVRVYRAPDWVADISLGAMQVLFGIVAGGVLSAMYLSIYERYRLFEIAPGWWSWAALFVGLDFCYYWFHRFAHRSALAWATHAPHHSSEDFNLAVALRQGPVQPIASRLFYLPLALVGFPIEMFFVIGGLNTVLQFWFHTEQIHKLPRVIEAVFNTPSHHRVHHGCNGRYIDRNHAGVLIVWDRLFGTFEPEGDRPVYGTIKPLARWNPVGAAVRPFVELWAKARAATRVVDKLLVWVMPPEWAPVGVGDVSPVPDARAKFDVRPGRGVQRYVLWMFAVTLVVLVVFLFVLLPRLDVGGTWLVAGWLVITFASLGALLDARPWAGGLEVARWLAAVPLAVSVAARLT